MKFNQNKYIKEYNQETYKMFQFRVKKSDKDVLEKLDHVDSRNSYIIELIKKDLEGKILTLNDIKKDVVPILKEYGLEGIYLFGSYSRGEATANSDIDIYYEKCSKSLSIFTIEEMSEKIELKTGKKIDIISKGTRINPIIKKSIEEDKIKLC